MRPRSRGRPVLVGGARARHPGHAVEVASAVRAVQCVPGVRHRRGTPPNVVETDAATWLALATGSLSWSAPSPAGRLSASGERADLSGSCPAGGRR